jgi:hypothetical protein
MRTYCYIKTINFIKNQTFEYGHRPSFSDTMVNNAYYQFHIDGIRQLRSVGEMTDHLFVSVKLVNGEGMINLYLSSAVFSTKQKVTGRQNVTNFWFEFYVQIGEDIENFLKFFNIDLPVVVDNFEFSPSEDFIPLYNFENEK